MATRSKASTKITPADLVKQLLAEKRKGSACYRKAGDLLDEIVAQVGVGKTIDCGRAGRFEIRDQFAKRNTVWKNVGLDRYALEQVD